MVTYTARDLSRSFPQGDSVIGSGHRLVCVYVYVCVCECARLKSNDEHHPDRDLAKTELSVNWNCLEMKAAAGSLGVLEAEN